MNDLEPELIELVRATSPVVERDPDWEVIIRQARQADLVRVRTRRRRFVLPVVVAVAATGAALVAANPWRGSPSLVDRAAAALTLPPGKVLYQDYATSVRPVQPTGVPDHVRSWLGPRGMFRELQTIDGVTHEFGRESSTSPLLRLNRKRGVLQTDCASDLYRFGRTPSEAIRRYLHLGTLKHMGDSVLAGHPVAILRGHTSQIESDTVYVDTRTYYPLKLISIFSSSPKQRYTVTWAAYRYLDATPRTLALADIQAEHPTTHVQTTC